MTKNKETNKCTTKELDEPFEDLENQTWYESIYWRIISILSCLTPKVLWNKLKRFCQRVIKGWDDSETWDIHYQFLLWLQPRLERFIELTNGYPHHYNSFDEWIFELKKRNEQLKLVIEYYYDEYKFPDTSYSDKKNDDIIYVKIDSYYKFQTDFHKWLSENINHLWW